MLAIVSMVLALASKGPPCHGPRDYERTFYSPGVVKRSPPRLPCDYERKVWDPVEIAKPRTVKDSRLAGRLIDSYP